MTKGEGNFHGFNPNSNVNKSKEWYTPRKIIDALGLHFDLDPASSEKANTLIQADNIFTKKDDGLTKEWFGKVWLNPPYGKDTPIWLDYALQQIAKNDVEVVSLIFSRTDTKWFHDLCTQFNMLCFVKGRINFIDGNTMEKGQGSTNGSLIVASGPTVEEAVLNSGLGYCVQRYPQYQASDFI